ncbi:MAG: transporter [Cupriavidus sp.]|jgi:hypothetical protein|uniref:ion channel n=1 Tax=Cupriavidus pauculus TaxID=82633 RepID=UPI0007843F54|nr:ion channel [Cupriavidus pauculus]MBU70396.1 transporter [Cupriavidus sp.]KAB0605181.1 two pore domain potassium channel family protein [Cupriavidus pauculus]MBY4729196.1 potassium channel family protein [Cupriavidus pauculus]MCM3605084.1 potassium channel family protein [Cupriavidus pauculus]UAK99539.1 potassium channel family protein [Cupriavidus pauculus]
MHLHLLIAAPVMLVCLLLQCIVVAVCLRYVHVGSVRTGRRPFWTDVALLAAVMLLTLLCNFAQMAVWAALFVLLGEFGEFSAAFYHSAVNFATLGYGDIVMSARWRMLGPIESAHGILMFGLSTALMTAAVLDVVKVNSARRNDAS